MEYLILLNDDYKELYKAVQEHLDDGWKLQGGVSCGISESDEYRYLIFVQAVVRPKDKAGGVNGQTN